MRNHPHPFAYTLFGAAMLAALPLLAQAQEADSVRSTTDIPISSDQKVVITANNQNPATTTKVQIDANGVSTAASVNTGALTVNTGGLTVAAGPLSVNGATTLSGAAVITGQTTLNGATTVNNSLSVAQNAAIAQQLSAGSAQINGSANVQGDTSLQGNVSIGQNANIAGSLSANNGATLSQGNSLLKVSNQAISLSNSNGQNALSLSNNQLAAQTQSAISLQTQNQVQLQMNGQGAALSAGPTLASNGTGAPTTGAGAVAVYNQAQTIAQGSTINDHLNGKQYQNKLSGNTYVDGNVYINGTLDYVSNTSASTSVIGANSGTSKLKAAKQAVSGQSQIAIQGNNGAAESQAALTLTNGLGNTHGVQVYEDRTLLSGGTRSTDMVLDDNGAAFRNRETGLPVQVTGVADGTRPYDAVNYQQLQSLRRDMSHGIASAIAMSNIPMVEPNKRFAMGVGVGGFDGRSAMAVGMSMRLSPNSTMNARVAGGNGGSVSYGAGAALSW